MSDVECIQRVARALHIKANLMNEDEATPIPLEIVEMIVCDAHLIFVDGMKVEHWETNSYTVIGEVATLVDEIAVWNPDAVINWEPTAPRPPVVDKVRPKTPPPGAPASP